MPEYYHAFDESAFTYRLTALIYFYKMSTREMAALLNYKSPTNITNISKYPMISKPPFHTLSDLNQLYGVSLDWLLGISATPYTEESINKAEVLQGIRFEVDSQILHEDSDRPENIMHKIISKMFPRDVIQGKLVLSDRFVLIFLLNYLSYLFDQYFTQNHTRILKKKTPNLAEILGFSNYSNPIIKPEGIIPLLKKHNEFASAFTIFMNTLNTPLETPYAHHSSSLPIDQLKIEKNNSTILDERWNFLSYLDKEGTDINRRA